MLELDSKYIRDLIQGNLDMITQERSSLGRLEDQMRALSERKRFIERGVEERRRSIITLYENLVIAEGIPAHIAETRDDVLKKKTRLATEDMLVSEQIRLTGEVASSVKALRDQCGHPFVIGYSGYSGSHSMDNDDAYTGYRTCVVCGLSENSQSHSFECFKIMVPSDTRLIQTSSGSHDERMQFHQFEVWQPLEPMVHEIFLKRKIHDFFKRVCAPATPR